MNRAPALGRPAAALRLEVRLTDLGQPRLSEGAQPYPRQLGRHAVPT